VSEFFQAIDMHHVYNHQTVFFVDEWGGNEFSYYNLSMSKLLNEKAENNGIRLYRTGLNVGWDGECEFGREGALAGALRCSECILDQSMTKSTAGAHLTNVLTWNRSLFSNDWPCYEVSLCHFQFGKRRADVRASLQEHVTELLAARRIYYGYTEGFGTSPTS
jgi:hypothetical protein